VKISTTRFGDINIDESRVIRMKRGMLGFEHLKKYVLLTQDGETPFWWFQSVEDGSVAFVLINPFAIDPEYEPVISDVEAQSLEVASSEDVVLFSVVTIHSDPFTVTANLRAPIMINAEKMLAEQIVLVDPDYPVRHTITENSVALEAQEKADSIPSVSAP